MRMDVDPRVSICQFSTYRWSFYEDVIRYSTLGFESMGLWRQKIDDFGRSAAIDLLYENKMSVSSVHWAGGFTGDGRTFSDSIEDAIESIHLASQVDADCLIIHPGSRNGHTTSNATRLMKSALSQLGAGCCGLRRKTGNRADAYKKRCFMDLPGTAGRFI